MDKDEINSLTRKNRVIKSVKKIREFIPLICRNSTIIPRDYQQEIINRDYFDKNSKGMLIWTCGLGKTITSLLITNKYKTILIGVPSIVLLEQWRKAVNTILGDIPCLVGTDGISDFLKNNEDNCVVLTTYASSHKVYTVCLELDFIFDMKILDEVHHLTSVDEETDSKRFVDILKVNSIKQLSLTATPKYLQNKDEEVISNDNIEQFGEIIDKKSLLWAIERDIICDYVIQTIISRENDTDISSFNIIDEDDKRLFLSAFVSLKSIASGQSHHLLIYSNKKENSERLIYHINNLLEKGYFNLPEIYYSSYNSNMKTIEKKDILEVFEGSKYGILTCVYCLGEGWDLPLLDGVVFSENMSSNIRIVQSVLRANRKDKNNVNKKAKIILPILDKDDWLDNADNSDLKKVKEVIYQMSLEDETISQKIKVMKVDVEKQYHIELNSKYDVEYDEDIADKIRLRTVNRTSLNISYSKAKLILSDKDIKSRVEYYKLCEKDIRLPKDPESVFKEKFIGWIDYLNISGNYYNLEMCKLKVREYLIKKVVEYDALNLPSVCDSLCMIDKSFPPKDFWTEYYNIKDIRDIINLVVKRKCNIVL